MDAGRRLVWAACAALAAAAAAAVGISLGAVGTTLRAQATPVVDQTTCEEPWAGAVPVTRVTWKAQTFVAGMDGRLVRVDLPGSPGGGSARLEIWPAGRCGLTRSDVLATAESVDVTRFEFAEPPRLVRGNLYALVVSHQGAGQHAWAYSSRTDCYPNRSGGPLTSTDAGVTWSRDQVDFFFTTWMLPDPAPAAPAPTDDAARAADAAHAGHDGAVRGGSAAENAAALADALARAAQRPPAADVRTVFVIALPTGNSDPTWVLQLSKDLAAAVLEASAHHGYADPAAQPALAYEIYQDRVFSEAAMPPFCMGQDFDLGALYEKYHLCDLIQRGAVDEVWFWEGGQGGVPEWASNGPEWEYVLNTGMPDCGRQTALMVFNNTRELDVALHSLGHRFEWTMRVYRPCDFTSATWPWNGPSAGCRDGSASDATGFVARPFDGNGFVGACGDVHWPPNLRRGVGADYDYANPAEERSICPDWGRDGQARETVVSCRTWGCTQFGYMVWWMQNIPGVGNDNRDAAGRPMPNWWAYLFGTGVSSAPPTATPTPDPPATVPPTSPPPSETPTGVPSPDPTPTLVDPPARRAVHLPALSNGVTTGALR